MEYSVVIVAAGSGSRMNLGYNKMLYKCSDGQTIIEKSVNLFRDDGLCKQIIIVASSDDLYHFYQLCGIKKITYVQGGKTRSESVYNGLQAVTSEYVLIHDGARPWMPKECLQALLVCLEEAKACILAMPVKDTIKVVVDDEIVTTPIRSTLYLAQTPQAFLTDEIIEAYNISRINQIEASDDAQIMELCGKRKVKIVRGSYENSKVTTIDDIKGK